MSSKNDLPADWKERIEKHIRHHNLILHGEEFIRPEMLLLLRKKEVEEAIAILYKWTKDKPDADRLTSRQIYWIFGYLLDGGYAIGDTPNRTRKEFLDIVKALEAVLEDNGPESEDGCSGPIEQYIVQYGEYAKTAVKTKRRQIAQRYALCRLRIYFLERYGFRFPVNKVVGLLMRAAYGGKWNAKMVAARASEWKNAVKLTDECRDVDGKRVQVESDMEGIIKRLRNR